jgi:hypothetical protein
MLSFDISGNLGIGTISPNYKLRVEKYIVRQTTDSKYSVEPVSVERMRITASGTFLLGIEPPRYVFDTEGMARLYKKFLYEIENPHE